MTKSDGHCQVVVIGGGAAGLFCASLLGQAGKDVILLEHNKQFGKKILISGGGRCNFTNIYTAPESFHGENPHFPKSSLSRYLPHDFIHLVESYEIPFYEKKLGQLFCQNSAKELLGLLLQECEMGGVKMMPSTTIEGVEKREKYFEVLTSKGPLEAEKVVVATGGLPIAKLGASDFGIKLAKKFNLQVEETAPALVPFTHPKNLSYLAELSGISVPAKLQANRGPEFEENVLFTHRGLSGPGILQVSSYWRQGEAIRIHWLAEEFNYGEQEFYELKEKKPRQKVLTYFKEFFAKKFVDILIAPILNDSEKNFSELSKKELGDLYQFLTNWKYKPDATEGYRKAEVMRGGVSCSELSSKSFAAKKVPGLYFIGEVVDVTGWLGGYNFQWAWASANACAQDIIKS